MQSSDANNTPSRIDAALSKLRRRISPDSLPAYAFSLFCVGMATLLRLGLDWLGGEISALGTYYPAILFAALIGGIGPGVLAAIAGSLIAWWAFMPPAFAFLPLEYGDLIDLLIYALASALIVWGANYFRRLAERLEDEENFRRLAVQELAHRLKNKSATIQAIISMQLRENPQIRDDILGRLHALSATDALIEEAQGQGAYMRDIAAAELGPYVASRAAIAGADVLLPPKMAVTMALLVHELATNSAKYGALSAPEGRVSVRWSLSGGVLNVEWQESGGPAVKAPTHRGFGLRLLTGALDRFGGIVETNFEPTGLVCKMRLNLPEDDRIAAEDGSGADERLSA